MWKAKLTRAKGILRNLYSQRRSKIIADTSARIDISEGARCFNCRIRIGQRSSLRIDDATAVGCDIEIGDDCTLTLHKNSCLRDVRVTIAHGGVLELNEGAMIDSPSTTASGVVVDNGALTLFARAHVMSSEITVRFGGKMTIGKYTAIAYDSELRCEEQVDIGAYGMISYGVCIYDTNSHATDWRERRKRIELCYPEGVSEELKPATRPVRIGDDVWIGKEVTITKGTVIGNRCIVGIRTNVAGEVVEDDSIVVAGKPRVISRGRNEVATAVLR